jgi:hypothetical protein
MFYSYEDACEAEVTKEEARQEIAKHDVEGGFELFLIEVGNREHY